MLEFGLISLADAREISLNQSDSPITNPQNGVIKRVRANYLGV